MNGILLLDKPAGKTSHDMVYFIRRLTGIKRVGHTGTLDPDATGVLPVCIGNATKVCDMLTVTDKIYEAELALGKTTDTQDASGRVLTESEVNVTQNDVNRIIEQFIGEIDQIPPMFSAVKKDGKKLYELARQGITVERAPRKVTIHSISVEATDFVNNVIKLRVHCSKGTYIRTLCEDIGNALGCGGYMISLRRVSSGGFSIDMCKTCEELSEIAKNGELQNSIIRVDEVFKSYDYVKLDDFLASKLKNGIRIRRKGLVDNRLYRIYDYDGEFIAVCRYNGNELVLEKSFWS